MLRHTIRLSVIAFVAGSFSVRTSAGASYNLAQDWSITNNGSPNNLWGYGVYTSGLTPTSYTPFTSASTNVLGGLDVWSFGGDPNLEKNTTNSPITAPNISWPAEEVAFGPFHGPTVARWTAPATSLYDITGAFTPIQSVNTSPNGYVYLGSTQLTNLTLSNTPGVATPFNDNLVLITAGQTLDFVVWGADGNNKTTEVQADIRAVPEPASVALFAVAGVVLTGIGLMHRRPRVAG